MTPFKLLENYTFKTTLLEFLMWYLGSPDPLQPNEDFFLRRVPPPMIGLPEISIMEDILQQDYFFYPIDAEGSPTLNTEEQIRTMIAPYLNDEIEFICDGRSGQDWEMTYTLGPNKLMSVAVSKYTPSWRTEKELL